MLVFVKEHVVAVSVVIAAVYKGTVSIRMQVTKAVNSGCAL